MPAQNNWHTITGGPGTGKTTLINMLAGLGYSTIPEAARIIIDEGLARGQTLQQIRGNENEWQAKILRHILDTEAGIDTGSLTFFDRAAHDGLAFLKFKGVTPGDYWEELLASQRKPHYKTVFITGPLPEFEHDYARTENTETTKLLTELSADVFKEFGMEPVRIPYMPPPERLVFILSHLGLPIPDTATIEKLWQKEKANVQMA